ncbi:MAG: hypothetical protein LUC27_05730 [Lachnospiraceae bacterium]|nr:hypothetical protein [Lachnospiraceae bacterium]
MNKQQKSLIIAVILGVLLYLFLPTDSGLTEGGVRMLAAFIPTVFLWLTCGTGWPSLLGVTVAALLLVTNGSSAYSVFWGNICAAAVIPFLMVASVMEENGTFEWLVKWVISRKFIHGRPTLFMIMFSLAMVIMSIFTAPQVVAVLFLTLLQEVTTSIGYTKESSFYKSHGLMVGWVSQTCDAILPWGRPYVLTLVALVAGFGFTKLNSMNYLLLAFPYLLILLVVKWVVIKLIMRPDVSKFSNFDDAAIRADLKAHPINRQGKIASLGMVFILICYLLASCSFLGGVADYFSNISIAASVSLVCALLCVITVDGKPIMDLGKAAAKVPWTMIMFLGAVMFFANNVGSSDFGVAAFLQNLMSPIVNNIPTMAAVLLGLALGSLLTNFCSNTVSGVAVCSAFVPAMMNVAGINQALVLAFGMAMISICGTAFCTPSASPTMGIIYSDMGVPYKGTAKYSVIVCAVMILVSAFILVPLGSTLLQGLV